MKDVLIIIPAYNEEKNIGKVVQELRKEISYADILVVNDSSTDNTVKVLENLNVNYLSLPFNLGYSGALQCGFKYAAENQYKHVIQFDGDGQHLASEAKKLYEIAIKNDYDIVLGSRFKNNSDYKNTFFRKLGTRFFQIIIRAIGKMEISDPTTGLQVLKRNVFERYSKINGFPEYPDANLIIEMMFENCKIEEVQVKMLQREFGVSMHSGVIKPFKYMIKVIYSILIIILKNFSVKRYYRSGDEKV